MCVCVCSSCRQWLSDLVSRFGDPCQRFLSIHPSPQCFTCASAVLPQPLCLLSLSFCNPMILLVSNTPPSCFHPTPPCSSSFSLLFLLCDLLHTSYFASLLILCRTLFSSIVVELEMMHSCIYSYNLENTLRVQQAKLQYSDIQLSLAEYV